ncbi:hypothetical protein [Mycolicibacterium sp. HS_4_1]
MLIEADAEHCRHRGTQGMPAPGKLIDSERRALRVVDMRLANISGLLQQMTGTVQEIAWVFEDACGMTKPRAATCYTGESTRMWTRCTP